jgi:hypothetical protein
MYDYQIVSKGSFVVWITCLLPSYQDKIISELVKKGYVVSACGDKESGNVCWTADHSPSALICLAVQSDDPKATASSVHIDIAKIMADNKFLYFSAIVSMRSSACWSNGNMSVSKTPPPIKKKDPNKSNVIPFKPNTTDNPLNQE